MKKRIRGLILIFDLLKGVVMTLPTDPEKAKKTAWKMVPDSGYPFIYNRKTNKICLENKAWTVPSQIKGRKDTFPNHRGNFGRVVTTQGLWVMGGLILPQDPVFIYRLFRLFLCTRS